MSKGITTAKVSSKYQIAIPEPVRSRAGIEPGQVFEIVASGRSLRLVPLRPLRELRGLARWDPEVSVRDKKDRL